VTGPARSQSLIVWNSTTNAVSGRFTCPDNHIVLVKTAYFTNNGTVAADIYLYFTNEPQSVTITVHIPAVAVGAVANWEGWIALNPTDSVVAYCATPGVDMWISGAILGGAPQFPRPARGSTKPV
jgi:hypothetical protein